MGFWGTSDPDGLSGDPLTIPQQFDPNANAAGGSGNTLTLPSQFDPNALMGSTSAPTGGPSAPSSGSGDIMSFLTKLLGGGSLFSGTQPGAIGGDLLGSLFGLNPSDAGGTGSEVGGIAGGLLGGPAGSFAGSALGTLIGNWVGGGRDKFDAPQQYIQQLLGSGNPLEALLAKYINRSGVQKGYDLSESSPAPFKPGRYADVIQLLSGMGLPKSLENTLGWKNESELSSMMPNATNLNFNQLHQIAPEIGALVNRSGGGKQGLMALLNQENGLAMKLKNAESY